MIIYTAEDDSWVIRPGNYEIVALNNLPLVAERLRVFLAGRINRVNYLHLVGFSLGGHIAGTVARKLKACDQWSINRITGN